MRRGVALLLCARRATADGEVLVIVPVPENLDDETYELALFILDEVHAI